MEAANLNVILVLVQRLRNNTCINSVLAYPLHRKHCPRFKLSARACNLFPEFVDTVFLPAQVVITLSYAVCSDPLPECSILQYSLTSCTGTGATVFELRDRTTACILIFYVPVIFLCRYRCFRSEIPTWTCCLCSDSIDTGDLPVQVLFWLFPSHCTVIESVRQKYRRLVGYCAGICEPGLRFLHRNPILWYAFLEAISGWHSTR
jgi:hypothetical protein